MSKPKSIIEQSREYFKILVEKMAGAFATPNSQIIVHEPKHGTVKGYAEERYGASITNPNLDLLPDGYRDALTRLDTRFKVDMLLHFAEEKCPELQECLRKIIDVRWYEEQSRNAERLAGDARVSEERLRSFYHSFNRSLEQSWQQAETFLDEVGSGQEKHRSSMEYEGKKYRMPEEPVSREALMEYIESRRPARRDSYDLYVQSLYAPDKKNNQFGMVMCDGTSSQYMTKDEAMRVKREGKNEFLSNMPENGVMKQPDVASKCNMASSSFGPEPENAAQLGENVEKMAGEASWPQKVCEAVKTAAKAALTWFGATAAVGFALSSPETAAVVGATVAGAAIVASGFSDDKKQTRHEEESASPAPGQ